MVARMVRKQICLEADLDRALAERARLLGVSQGEVVRSALRRELVSAREDSRLRAWGKALAIMEERARLGPLPGGRTWTREDLYDD